MSEVNCLQQNTSSIVLIVSSYTTEHQSFRITMSGEAMFDTLPRDPKASPQPSIVIPVARDADFIGRSEIFKKLLRCIVPGSRTVIVGQSGVG